MLSKPVLENPENLEAAQILIKDVSVYRVIVQRLFHKPLQLKDDSSELSKDSDKCIRSIKVSFDDYYKTWPETATSKAAECYRTPLLEDPNFIRKYYKWKKVELKHHKEWNVKYSGNRDSQGSTYWVPGTLPSFPNVILAMLRSSYTSQCAHASPSADHTHLQSHNSTYAPGQRSSLITQLRDSQPETEVVRKTDETEEGWKTDDDNLGDSWEKEVYDLVTWTNTLGTDTLED